MNVTTTPAYTPVHNGQAERMNRTIIEGIRVALLSSSAPKFMWGEALHWFVATRNLTHIVEGKNKEQVPLQLLKNMDSKPSIKHLRPFGHDVWVRIPTALITDKLEPRSAKAIFVGYDSYRSSSDSNTLVQSTSSSTTTSAYRVMDLNCKITVTREVTSDEYSFTMMKELRAETLTADIGDEVSTTEYYSTLTDQNELKLVQLISKSDQSEEVQAIAPIDSSIRRSARVSAPPSRYGMIAPGDIGQALSSSSSASSSSASQSATDFMIQLEDTVTDLTFPFASAVAPAPADRAAALAEQRDRDLCRAQARTNSVVTRPVECDKSGEIKTPSQRCTANNKKSTRCGSKTCNGEYCWQHLGSEMHLCIKKSIRIFSYFCRLLLLHNIHFL